uniref:Ubiquitin-like domain-containing protein n=1 Tax=Oryzias melastigma TaxID=30732 RepID=A0A3B3DJ07_ORYME
MEKKYWVEFRSMTGQKKEIYLCDTEEEMQKITVLQLKEKIDQQLPQYNREDLYLLYRGNRLDEDSKLLSEYGIQHNSLIQVVMSIRGGGCSPEAYKEYLEKCGKGDKKVDKKHMSMECLAGFKEDDLTHKEQKKSCSVS